MLVQLCFAWTTLLPSSPEVQPSTRVNTATSALAEVFLQGPRPNETRTDDRFEADPPSVDEGPTVDVGGALRFNLQANTWSGPELAPNRGGFDMFRVNIAARYKGLILAGEYRFYAGYQMLKHGYLGYEPLPERLRITAGVLQVPFGILPYASHNYFFNLPYYVGLEDDYDLGFRIHAQIEPIDIDLAFFLNDEGHFTGSSLDSARYSYDLVRVREGVLASAGIPEARGMEETNQGNLRIAIDCKHGPDLHTEFGVSGQVGQTFDRISDQHGLHWAAAAHADGHYGWVNVQFEGGYFDLGRVDDGIGNRDLVTMGAYDAPYAVASRAWFAVANVAVEVPVDFGPLQSITFYQDYSTILKVARAFADSQQSTTGALLTAGPLYLYLDAAVGLNHPWLGPNFLSALGTGDPNADWEVRFNANAGWYF